MQFGVKHPSSSHQMDCSVSVHLQQKWEQSKGFSSGGSHSLGNRLLRLEMQSDLEDPNRIESDNV